MARQGLPRTPGAAQAPPPAPVQENEPPQQAAEPAASASASAPAASTGVRRGLPRPGAAPAAAESSVAQAAPGQPAASAAAVEAEPVAEPVAAAPAAATGRRGLPRPGAASAPAASQTPAAAAPAAADAPAPAKPEAAAPKVQTAATAAPAKPAPAPPGALAKLWATAIGKTVLLAAGLLVLLGAAVLLARWLVGMESVQEFLTRYPGETHLPKGAPVGLPAWMGWQHFFNIFLMVLIIRSGWQVRTQRRPPASWTAKFGKNPKKISINLWFHQFLDILWLVNGVVFVVLLLSTGQWMRVVPSSWEVFPNALSAALQYLSLDWPTENGWVNYNSLQVLAYFATIFLAAPLAAVTGFRMSGAWPSKAEKLSRAYPIEVARAIHLPVMFYFVAFIVVHVALVFSTGALRNLNHMYAAQDAVNWTGFWIFFASLLVIVVGWFAARPILLAPLASLFGKVGR
ncbi:cytochrome b/b6 domain-containing protein [Glutamicibacter protophormiae]|uniref:cytochrome b/b6 domain-containing protein n=1 Tax=Glutamicibacter protophormiae TaxID=37930 RepID=UPI003318A779